MAIILGALGGRGLRIAVVLSTSWADVSRRSMWRLLWRLIIDEQKSSKLVATLLPRFVCTVGPALGAYDRFARHQQRVVRRSALAVASRAAGCTVAARRRAKQADARRQLFYSTLFEFNLQSQARFLSSAGGTDCSRVRCMHCATAYPMEASSTW